MLTWFWPALRDAPAEDAAALPEAVVAAGAAHGPSAAFARLIRGLAARSSATSPLGRARHLALLTGDAALADVLAAPPEARLEAPDAPPPLLARLLETLLGRLNPPQVADWHPALDPVAWRLRAHADLAHLAALEEALAQGPVSPQQVLALFEASLDRRWLWLRVAGTLALADDQVDPAERALAEHLADRAGLPPAEAAQAVDLALAEPLAPQALAARATDPTERELLVRLMLLMGLADGRVDDAEGPLTQAIAHALGVGPDAQARLQRETAAAWPAPPDRPAPLAASSYRRVEALVRRHMGAIATEVRETGDLLALLARATHTPLTADEQRRVQAQLLDLCRSVPALAVFALPGGAVLLPLLARVLPFHLAPSAFRAPDAAARPTTHLGAPGGAPGDAPAGPPGGAPAEAAPADGEA